LNSAHGLIALDSCSDVSMASVDILTNVRECPPIFLHHLGGTSRLDLCGDVCLDDTFITVFAVSIDKLPPGFTILFGLPFLRSSSISLDFVRDHPGCCLEQALPVRFGKVDRSHNFRPLYHLCVAMLTLIIVSGALCTSVFPDWVTPTNALLSQSNGGHSLFAAPPFSVRADIVWTPPFDVGTPQANLPAECPVSLDRDPPEVGLFSSSCFMQTITEFPSSFSGGHALKATMNVLPLGHQIPCV
jgi:hypothetical protein